MSEEAPEITMETLAATYLRIKNRIDVLERECKDATDVLKRQQDAIAMEMRERLKREGATSSKTPAGTVIMTPKTRYFAQDWDRLHAFIKDNDAIDLLERRIAQGNLVEFLKANPDNPPPGISSVSEYAIVVRKPSSN